jgi:hypothetical protein
MLVSECSLRRDSTSSGHTTEPHELASNPRGMASFSSLVNESI